MPERVMEAERMGGYNLQGCRGKEYGGFPDRTPKRRGEVGMWGRGQAARAEIEPAHFPTSPLPDGLLASKPWGCGGVGMWANRARGIQLAHFPTSPLPHVFDEGTEALGFRG